MHFSVYYQNVRGLRTKCQALYSNTSKHDFDIICLTETSLNDSFVNNVLFDNRYLVFRHDRDDRTSAKSIGGGSLIAIKKCLSPNIIQLSNYQTAIEDVWVCVSIDKIKLRICCAYIPNNVRNTEAFKEHINSINSLSHDHPDDPLLIVGDYNLPHLFNPTGTQSNQSSIKKSSILVDSMTLCRLKQHNKVVNHNQRILDLVLCNGNSISDIVVDKSLNVLSTIDPYHPPLKISLYCRVSPSYNFRKTKRVFD